MMDIIIRRTGSEVVRDMNFVTIFKPGRANIILFLLLAVIFLSHLGDYQGAYDGTINSTTETQTVVGYPYIYYRSTTSGTGTFSTRGFLKNLAVYYFLASIFLAFANYAYLTFKKGDNRQKVIFTSSIFYLLLGFIVLLKTFGGQWLNKYTERESFRTIQILLTLGVNPNSLSGDSKLSPLIIAARKNNVALAKLLLTYGADVERGNILGRTPLHEAVRANALQVANLLIKSKANIHALDGNQSMPIHFIKGYEVALMLLDHGALANVKNTREQTPIFFAPDDRTLKLLTSRGAKLNVSTNDGTTPIAYATNPSVIRHLIKKGANVNSRDSKGKTPLHRLISLDSASNKQRDAVIKYLVKRGANVDLRDENGMSPLHYSIRDCDLEVAELFYLRSREVRRQLTYRKLRGQLATVSKSKGNCWRKIKTQVAKSGKLQRMMRKARIAASKPAKTTKPNQAAKALKTSTTVKKSIKPTISLKPGVREKSGIVKPVASSQSTTKKTEPKRAKRKVPKAVQPLYNNPESEPVIPAENTSDKRVIDKSSNANGPDE